ncbi:MAG: hypothetical protein IH617_12395, partial [Hydrogenophaga sp.]|nr:hypothetical protein [Hydrogenophaga sp.]
IVLDHAAADDAVAQSIVERGASELAALARAVCVALEMDARGVKFAGGLLSEPNRLSSALSAALELPEFPRPLYSPLEGAALLAQMAL